MCASFSDRSASCALRQDKELTNDAKKNKTQLATDAKKDTTRRTKPFVAFLTILLNAITSYVVRPSWRIGEKLMWQDTAGKSPVPQPELSHRSMCSTPGTFSNSSGSCPGATPCLRCRRNHNSFASDARNTRSRARTLVHSICAPRTAWRF